MVFFWFSLVAYTVCTSSVILILYHVANVTNFLDIHLLVSQYTYELESQSLQKPIFSFSCVNDIINVNSLRYGTCEWFITTWFCIPNIFRSPFEFAYKIWPVTLHEHVKHKTFCRSGKKLTAAHIFLVPTEWPKLKDASPLHRNHRFAFSVPPCVLVKIIKYHRRRREPSAPEARNIYRERFFITI